MNLISKRLTHGTRQSTVLPLFALFVVTACGGQTQLPPIEDTRPSTDQKILNDAGLMSDGKPVPPHTTTTVATSVELVSDGLIGGIGVDAEGNIYAADLGSHIWKIAPDGQTTLFSDDFNDPSGMLVLPNGDILQSEWTNNRIYRISPDGSRQLFSSANLNGPVAIVQRPVGDFVVANSRGKFLARVPRDGGDAEVILQDDRITQPNGLAIDPAGNIYIADLDSAVVIRWSVDGVLSPVTELPGRGNAHYVYANDMLYVNKIWDHAVYVVDPSTGAFGLVAGTGQPGYKDGISGVATLEEPNAIAVAADGKTVYVNTHRGRMGRNQTARMIVRKLRRVD